MNAHLRVCVWHKATRAELERSLLAHLKRTLKRAVTVRAEVALATARVARDAKRWA